MKTIIAGSRNITDYQILLIAITESQFEITSVVSGTALGVDRLGEAYAHLHKLPIEKYPADWNKYGRSAGAIRNKEMSKNADALIAIWDGSSPGTKNMINVATSAGLQVFIYKIN